MFGAISAVLAIGSAAAFIPSVPKPLQKALVAPIAILGINSAPMVVPPAHADGAVSAATVTRAGVLYGPRVIGLKTAAEKGDFAAFEAQDGAARLFNSGTYGRIRSAVEVFFAAPHPRKQIEYLVLSTQFNMHRIRPYGQTGAFAMNRPLKKQVQAAYADVQKAVKAKVRTSLSNREKKKKKKSENEQRPRFLVQNQLTTQDAAALKSAWATYFKTARLDQTNPFKKGDRGQTVSSDFSPFLNNENF